MAAPSMAASPGNGSEMTMRTRSVLLVGILMLVAAVAGTRAGASAPVTPARVEIDHPASGHEVHLSAPAIAVDRDGPLVAWMAEEGVDNVVYVGRPGGPRVRVNPATI